MNKEYKSKIKDYTKDIQQNIDQEAVLQTIKNCKKTFVQAEDYPLSYMEFLYEQMHFIQKRWWVLQGCLLVVLWIFLNNVADVYEMQRLMGMGACLFAIFLVPEIWKNRRNQAMEIEGAAYYSLRQVCMARILLFGFMDLLIVTAFAVSVVFTVRISAQMFAVNFLIPFNVTGAICFRFLYCKRSESEYLASAGCFLFMILWVFIISREEIYCKISGTVWCVVLILSIIYLIYVVKRSQSFCGKMYEV